MVTDVCSLKDQVGLKTIGAHVVIQEALQVEDMQGKVTGNRWIRTTLNLELLSVGQSGG